jgi:hypothetical protein
MYKIAIILYLTCFSVYILFSRQPDYFDGEHTIATIHFIKESGQNDLTPYAFYTLNKKNYSINASYLFRNLQEGEKVDLIYEAAKPGEGAVYSWWGYWLTWGEILFSIGLLIVMFYIAVSITNNPTPEAVLEQLNYKPIKKRKYDV